MLDQKDPSVVYMMIVCESEEKARAREQDPRREPSLAEARATMAEIFEGPVEFTDLTVWHRCGAKSTVASDNRAAEGPSGSSSFMRRAHRRYIDDARFGSTP